MVKVEIKLIDEAGNVQIYKPEGTLFQIIWDAFLIAEQQDEQWNDKDTCKLIIKKLKGIYPIRYTNDIQE